MKKVMRHFDETWSGFCAYDEIDTESFLPKSESSEKHPFSIEICCVMDMGACFLSN